MTAFLWIGRCLHDLSNWTLRVPIPHPFSWDPSATGAPRTGCTCSTLHTKCQPLTAQLGGSGGCTCRYRGRATHQSRLEFLPKASRYRSTAACDGVCSRGTCGGLLQRGLRWLQAPADAVATGAPRCHRWHVLQELLLVPATGAPRCRLWHVLQGLLLVPATGAPRCCRRQPVACAAGAPAGARYRSTALPPVAGCLLQYADPCSSRTTPAPSTCPTSWDRTFVPL